MKEPIENLILELKLKLAGSSNPQKAIQMKAYMKNHFDFLGIQSQERRLLSRSFIAGTNSFDMSQLWRISELLWYAPEREYQYIAMDMWSKHLSKLSSADINKVEKLIVAKSWWDTVDWLAARMVGQILSSDKDLKKHRIDAWLKSDNIWLNRSCLLFQLFYRDGCDFVLLKHCITTLMSKNEFFIQKAIGWCLRQHSKYNPSEVLDFINIHNLSPLARKEALKWLMRNNK